MENEWCVKMSLESTEAVEWLERFYPLRDAFTEGPGDGGGWYYPQFTELGPDQDGVPRVYRRDLFDIRMDDDDKCGALAIEERPHDYRHGVCKCYITPGYVMNLPWTELDDKAWMHHGLANGHPDTFEEYLEESVYNSLPQTSDGFFVANTLIESGK
jgi:hypothetical protein